MPDRTLPQDGQAFGSEERPASDVSREELAKLLRGYNQECEAGRTERDRVWRDQWDLYWQRVDMSAKAPWQSASVMPQGPQFIERFAAALRKALMQSGEWYSITSPPGQLREFIPVVRKILDHWLSRAGETATRAPLGFATIFEEAMKMGAISKVEIAVTAKTLRKVVPKVQETEIPPLTLEDAPEMQRQVVHVEEVREVVDIEVLDPRTVWRDPSGRDLYRRRRTEVDLHTLKQWAEQQDANGEPIWHADAIKTLTAYADPDLEQQRADRSGERLSGGGVLGRKPIVLDEYLGTFLNEQGDIVAENSLCVMANEKAVVRGPEPNPFWHAKDWILDGAVLRVPGTLYHRSYVEAWSPLAKTFTEMTNLILDATYTGSMNAFAGDPTVLEDPKQLESGVSPNKFFILEEGRRAEEFIEKIDLGRLPSESLNVWQSLKDLLQEGAVLNDIMLGNIPDKSDVKATEVNQATEATAAFVQAIAENIQLTCLDGILDRVWQTALQIMDLQKEPELLLALGEQGVMLAALSPEERLQLIGGPYTFKAHGLTSVLERAEKIRRLLGALQAIASNEALMQAFQQQYDMTKLPDLILRGFGIDPTELKGDGSTEPPPQQPVPGPPAPTGEQPSLPNTAVPPSPAPPPPGGVPVGVMNG